MDPIIFTLFKEVDQDIDHRIKEDESGKIIDEEEIEGPLEIEYEIYVVNPDGQLLINPLRFYTEFEMVYEPAEAFRINLRVCTEEELAQINLIGRVEFCKKHNDPEVERILKERKRFEILVEEFPIKDNLQTALSAIEEIILKFENWYAFNDLKFPMTKYKKKVASRLKLSKVEKEDLYPKIADAVNDKYYEGILKLDEVYTFISEQSEKLFNIKIAPGQIKGIYERFIKKNSNYKR